MRLLADVSEVSEVSEVRKGIFITIAMGSYTIVRRSWFNANT